MNDYSANPLLPIEYFVPDVEARDFDGVLYLYGSFEKVKSGRGWNSCDDFHVFSSTDMINWTDHGVCFSVADIKWANADGVWAPDCVCVNGKYYLYYCLPDGRCGVAVCDSPAGKFTDLGQISGVQGIDPAVLIDGNDKYLYWGQLDNVRVAKLKDNMTEIIESTIVQPLTVKEHAFHEGISARKIGDKYYLVYTETVRHGNKATSQGYAVSDNPTSGFVYKNTIVDNFGCDPKTWNNHGSIQKYKGNWYIFYHRSTHCSEAFRQVCVEPIIIDANGDIKEVPITSSGASGAINANSKIPAYRACLLSGNARIAVDENSDLGMSIVEIKDGDTATFRYLLFNGQKTVSVCAKADAKERVSGVRYQPPRVELYVDGDYYQTVFIGGGKDFIENKQAVKPIYGKHTLTLKFFGDFTNASLEKIRFE